MTEIRRCQTDSGPPVRTKMPGYLAVPGNGDALTGNVGAWSRPDSRAPSFSAVASDSVEPIQEAEPMCHRNRPHTYRKDDRSVTGTPDCMCWHCSECRPRLRRKWIEHATRVWNASDLHLGVVIVNVSCWASFSRKLRKYGCRHFKVKLGMPQYGVIIGTKSNVDDLPFHIDPITKQNAIKRFTGWVNSIQDGRGGNPVSSSHAWSLPEHQPTGWTKVAVGPTPAQVRELAAAAGVHFADRVIHGLDVTVCHGETAAMDALCDSLAALSPKPSESRQRVEFNEVPEYHADGRFGVALEDFQPCGDGYYSGRVVMT